jgi:hypothetical protein
MINVVSFVHNLGSYIMAALWVQSWDLGGRKDHSGTRVVSVSHYSILIYLQAWSLQFTTQPNLQLRLHL